MTVSLCSDPWLWRHERALHATEEETRAALVRRMVDHVMAANQVQADTLYLNVSEYLSQ